MKAVISKLKVESLRHKPEFNYSLWLMLAQVIASLSAFCVTYVLANFVNESVVGYYRFVLAFYAVFATLALFGMNSALIQSVATGKSGTYFFALKRKIKWGGVGTIGFIFTASYYYFEGNTELATALLLAGALLPWFEAYSLYSAYLNGLSRFKLSSLSLSFDRSLSALVIVLVSWLNPQLIALVAAYFISHTVIAYGLHLYTIKKVPPNLDVDEGLMKFSEHLTWMSILSIISGQLDKFVLFWFFGPVALASFWVASVLPQEMSRVTSLVTSALFPRTVKTPLNELMPIIKKVFWLTVCAGLLISLIYYLLATWIFSLFLPAYMEAVNWSVCLMLALSLVPHLFVWNIFTAKKMLKELYYYNLGEPILTIFLYLIFVPAFGVWGLVYAFLLKSLILNLIALVVLYHYLPKKLKSNYEIY